MWSSLHWGLLCNVCSILGLIGVFGSFQQTGIAFEGYSRWMVMELQAYSIIHTLSVCSSEFRDIAVHLQIFFSRPFLAVSRDRSFRMIMTWFDPIFNLLRWEDDQITSLHCALSHSYTYTDNIKKNSCLLKYGFSNLIPTREKLVWNQIMWLLRLLICCLRFLEQCSPEWVPYFTWAVVRHECRHLQRGCKL